LIDIKLDKFKIIACPGCYPTSIQLPLVPIIKKRLINTNNIIIDSKSGYSGAGKNLFKKFKFKNIYESASAYGISSHRHLAEIDQQLKKYLKIKSRFSLRPIYHPCLEVFFLLFT
jgi:N-acetyl-gamma-glutamyl-phosphate reductase